MAPTRPLRRLLRAGWRALVLSDLPADAVLAGLEDLLMTERSTADAPRPCATSRCRPTSVGSRRSAGHPPPVLAGVGALVDEHLRSPLGMRFGERRWQGTAFELPEVWSIKLYTDGLFEIRSDDGEILSIDDVPGAVEQALVDDFIDPDLLLARFAARSTEGWRATTWHWRSSRRGVGLALRNTRRSVAALRPARLARQPVDGRQW